MPSHYKKIGGEKYDRSLIEMAEGFTKSGGVLSVDEAEALWKDALDGPGVTELERRTLRYTLDNFKYTAKARERMEQLLGEGGKEVTKTAATTTSTSPPATDSGDKAKESSPAVKPASPPAPQPEEKPASPPAPQPEEKPASPPAPQPAPVSKTARVVENPFHPNPSASPTLTIFHASPALPPFSPPPPGSPKPPADVQSGSTASKLPWPLVACCRRRTDVPIESYDPEVDAAARALLEQYKATVASGGYTASTPRSSTFDAMDTNGDGVISRAEFNAATRRSSPY